MMALIISYSVSAIRGSSKMCKILVTLQMYYQECTLANIWLVHQRVSRKRCIVLRKKLCQVQVKPVNGAAEVPCVGTHTRSYSKKGNERAAFFLHIVPLWVRTWLQEYQLPAATCMAGNPRDIALMHLSLLFHTQAFAHIHTWKRETLPLSFTKPRIYPAGSGGKPATLSPWLPFDLFEQRGSVMPSFSHYSTNVCSHRYLPNKFFLGKKNKQKKKNIKISWDFSIFIDPFKFSIL